jgi:hypothetical protein
VTFWLHLMLNAFKQLTFAVAHMLLERDHASGKPLGAHLHPTVQDGGEKVEGLVEGESMWLTQSRLS